MCDFSNIIARASIRVVTESTFHSSLSYFLERNLWNYINYGTLTWHGTCIHKKNINRYLKLAMWSFMVLKIIGVSMLKAR